jgi:hypothetical protein
MTSLRRRPVILVGSSPAAPKLSSADLRRFRRVAINNAWMVREDFEFSIYPYDMPIDRRPPTSYGAQHISNVGYFPSLRNAGGIIFCGATMSLAAGYWSVSALGARIVGYYACDMIYRGAVTHFYGSGGHDPLRDDVSLQSLDAKGVRLFAWALQRGALLLNFSEEPETRLVFPRQDLRRAHLLPPSISGPWRELLSSASAIFAEEAAMGFDPTREDYWNLVSGECQMAQIRDLNRQWLNLLPLIDEGWSARDRSSWLGWARERSVSRS